VFHDFFFFYSSDLLENKTSAEFLAEMNLTLLSILHFLLQSSSCELQKFRKTPQFYELRKL